MLEENKKPFEFPSLEIVKYDIKNIITTASEWEDEEDWGGGEV